MWKNIAIVRLKLGPVEDDAGRKGGDEEGKEIRVYRNLRMIKGIKIDSNFNTKEISLPLCTSPCKKFKIE